MDNGTLGLALDKFAAARNLLLPKTQKDIKSFLQFVLMVIVFTIILILQWHKLACDIRTSLVMSFILRSLKLPLSFIKLE